MIRALLPRLAEPAAFVLLAGGLHLGAWAVWSAGAGGGVDGAQAASGAVTLSLTASPELTRQIAAWDSPPEAPATAPALTPPQPMAPAPEVALPSPEPRADSTAALPVLNQPPPEPEPAPIIAATAAPPAEPEPKPKPKTEPPAASPRPAAQQAAPETPAAAPAPAPKATPDAGASLGEGQRQRLMADWAGRIRARIDRVRTYPKAAQTARLQGTVTLRLDVGADGRLVAVGISESSGHAVLDEAALAAVRRAGRLPAAPKGLTGARHGFILPLVFRL